MLADYEILRAPGPTPVPPSVMRAMNHPMHAHHSPQTNRLMQSVSGRLKPVFGTAQDVVVMAGTGTAALEATIVNSVKPGEEVLVLVTGAFGERYVSMCEKFGIPVHRIESEWGTAADPDEAKKFLQDHPAVKAVFATHCETSTGVLNPVKELAAAVREHSDALISIDGVSSVGGAESKLDEWGVDFLATGSQKAMMLPPGLAFTAVSERAWKKIESNDRGRFYFDLLKYRESLAEDNSPFTPPIPLLYGLDQSLQLMEEEGLEHVYARHRLMKEMTRAAFRALDVPLLTADECASPTVTAVKPADFEADAFKRILQEEFGLTVASGLGKLQGQIFRVGHMGYCTPLDLLQLISAAELALKKLGKNVTYGTGVAAAQEVYERSN